MARPTRPLVWHQLRFALPLAQDAAVGLVAAPHHMLLVAMTLFAVLLGIRYRL